MCKPFKIHKNLCFGAPARSRTQNLLVRSTVDSQMSFSTLQFYIMILRLQSNVFNGFLLQVQCLSITLRLQIPCTLTCTLIPYTLTHYVRLVLFEVRCLLRRCGDVLRIIYDADKNILKDSFCSIDKKINKPYIEVS